MKEGNAYTMTFGDAWNFLRRDHERGGEKATDGHGTHQVKGPDSHDIRRGNCHSTWKGKVRFSMRVHVHVNGPVSPHRGLRLFASDGKFNSVNSGEERARIQQTSALRSRTR